MYTKRNLVYSAHHKGWNILPDQGLFLNAPFSLIIPDTHAKINAFKLPGYNTRSQLLNDRDFLLAET